MGQCHNKMGFPRRRITMQIVVDIVLWFAVALPVLFLFLQGVAVERGFFCDDESLSHPFRPETISTPVLIAGGFGISIFVVVLVEVLNCIDRRCQGYCQSTEDLLYCAKGYAVFLVGFVVQELIVETVKCQMGSLRPNFFAVCRPQFNRSLCPGYISNYTCTSTEYGKDELRDVRQSFPSGHSAFSMYIAVFYCLYIQRRLHIHFSRTLKFLLQSGLVFIAFLCGLGRITDNKHHPRDVTVGFIIGTIVAIAVYKTICTNLLSEDTGFTNKDTNEGSPETPSLCCACASSINNEPQTPSPLLQNEFSNNGTSGPFAPKLRDIPFSVRRHMSTPITPNARYEDV